MSVTNSSFSSEPTDFKKFYSNGTVPACELKSAPGLPPSVQLHPQAAEQLAKLMAAARAAGFPFRISSSYRTYERQVDLVGGDPSTIIRGVAEAGNSKHGWGTAIDIGELWDEAVRVASQFNRENRPLGIDDGNGVWDKLDADVHEHIRQNNAFYQWLDRNAPTYGWVNPDWARNGGDYDECWHWEYRVFSNNWPQVLPPTLTNKPTRNITAITTPCGSATARIYYSRIPIGSSPATSSITPYIGSLESFHPNIQYELTRRRISAETANTYMPFVKLTSLVNVYRKNTLGGAPSDTSSVAYAPSLGPHGVDFTTFNEIYFSNVNTTDPQDNNRSIVGYAIQEQNGTPVQIALVVNADDATNLDAANIPMPGITEVNVERSTAGPMGVRGGLVKMELKIAAYSVGQLNTLITYFLRPATRVVLELGRRSSNPAEDINPYPWTSKPPVSDFSGPHKDFISQEFTSLIYNPTAQKEFLNNYVYGNNGNYEIFIGYVVKFDVKYNKNNIYDISLTIHSVQQFELPAVNTGVRSTCADSNSKCRAMDVREYFDDSVSFKPNHFTKLMTTYESRAVADSTRAPTARTTPNTDNWADHFIAIKNPTPADTGAGSRPAGLDENEYFVSWRFFVEKILHDRELGLISVIPENATNSTDVTNSTQQVAGLSPREMLSLGLIRRVAPTDNPKSTDLLANEVGYHPSLRSVDPNVMIIYNPYAQANRSQDEIQGFINLIDASITDDSKKAEFNDNSMLENFITGSDVGAFRNVSSNIQSEPGSSFLDYGVWLNTKAIKQAFSTADTVTMGLNSLLMSMNAATQGYWNLQLYSTDREHSGLFVIDMGLSKQLPKTGATSANDTISYVDREENEPETSALKSISDITPLRYNRVYISDGSIGVSNKPRYIYMFNRGTKLLDDGEQLGSDLLDLSVEFNLPQVIAVQAIANIGGPAQKSTLQSIDIGELQRLSLIPNLFAQCNPTDVCKEEDCNQDDTSTLEARLTQATDAFNKEEAALNVIKASVSASRQNSSAENSAVLTQLEEQEKQAETKLIQASQAVDSARSTLYASRVERAYGNTMVISTAQQLSSLGTLLKFVEFNPSSMMQKLNIDSTNAEDNFRVPPSHAFNSSNLTKTTVGLTLPGIGGIELFQSFVVDRVPSILQRGFYVVTKIVHKFSSSAGWVSTVEGRFRFRPIQESSGTGATKPPCVPGTPALRPTGAVTAARPRTDRPQASATGTGQGYLPARPLGATPAFINLVANATNAQLASLRAAKVKTYRELKTQTFSITYTQAALPVRADIDSKIATIGAELAVINTEIERRIAANPGLNANSQQVFGAFNRQNPTIDWLQWQPNVR